MHHSYLLHTSTLVLILTEFGTYPLPEAQVKPCIGIGFNPFGRQVLPVTINLSGATSQKNAIDSKSLLRGRIDFTLGAENGPNLDIGGFAEQAGSEGHWRPITLLPRSMPTMTGHGSASGLRGISQSGTSSTPSTGDFMVLVELSGAFIAML